MKLISRTIYLGIVTFGMTALYACGSLSDPAAEAPVEITAGMYHLSTNGQFSGFNMPQLDGPGQINNDICVLTGEEAAFPKLVAGFFRVHKDCSFQPGDRIGNAISGIFICPTDPERAPGGSMNASYSGSVATDRVELTGQVILNLPKKPNMTPEESAQLDQAAKMMNDIKIVVTAKRTGDCNTATQKPFSTSAQTSAPFSTTNSDAPEVKFGEPTNFGEPTSFGEPTNPQEGR